MPSRSVSVVFRKEEIGSAEPPLHGCAAVVIDVLRASSTIVTALANGASQLRLAATPEQARAIASTLAAGDVILGGERGGVRIPGFDLGNSPREYTPERVGGKTIVFTTTNGTTALQACAAAGAGPIWIGCLLNADAVAQHAASLTGSLVLVCAGTEGIVGIDDLYAAGAILSGLKWTEWDWDDSARVALSVFQAAHDEHSTDAAHAVLRVSRGGRNLIAVGLADDLPVCSGSLGAYAIVPVYTACNDVVNLLHA